MKKKIFIAALVWAALSGSAFAKKWTNNIGVGASLPVSSVGVDKKGVDDIDQIGYGVEGVYMGLHENGFTAKASISIGVMTSRDVSVQQERKTNIGVFENISLGAGYSFVSTERFLLGALGVVGIELGQYSVEEDDVAVNGGAATGDSKNSLSLVTASMGAELFAVCRLTVRFGLFAGLNARWILGGTASSENQEEWREGGKKWISTDSDDTNLLGKSIVQPTVGVIWTF